ncbi:CBS domain-containing protein [Salinarimonas soli]|uniref:CBS domain-containing protein n=1 Tax=Salinarimonas soli TaxID=1638099 RepID=A0A5B2VTT6_9HYPH|nr:CBS domain-containing protein [Salinarimonas soli]KAA2242194.1 CBS domain-containing protein [Salinarimonas soli]
MSVQHILAEKGGDVVTIAPDRTLAEAAHLLAERRIGAVIVSEGSRAVAGILSERDIVRALARGGAAALDHPVSRHMTAEVVTCTPDIVIVEVMELMTRGKFRHVPVVQGGRLIGIVSIGDIVKRRLAEVETEQQALREYITS